MTTVKDQIKALLKEAEIYQSQGLLSESQNKFKEAIRIIKSNAQLKNRDKLILNIQNKIKHIDTKNKESQENHLPPDLSLKAQNLIKDLFSFSETEDPEKAKLEGALALAKFGQIERAIAEFKELLKIDSYRLNAAKNILRCHLSVSAVHDAVAQYYQWLSSKSFPKDQLESIRAYLEDTLKRKGMESLLPDLAEANKNGELRKEEHAEDFESNEFLDITSVGITCDSGPQKGEMVEFDVNFQNGDLLSLIISEKDSDAVRHLETGIKIHNIQFFSPIAIFKGSAVVASRTEIKHGPKKGDICLDIKIVNQ